MKWKKNRFSYLMWLVYTLFTAGILLVMAGWLGERLLEGVTYGRRILSISIVVLIGWAVFVIRWFVESRKPAAQETAILHLFLEAVVAVLFLVFGFMLRMDGMSGQGELAAYYETAMVAEGQSIPSVVHGASYLYLQLLHMLFMFLGNKFSVAVWLQIILQMMSALLLFTAVRKLAGPIAALVSLGFLMCTGYMVQRAVTLSPQMLYLLIFAIGLNVLPFCQGGKLRLGGFLGAGLWIGLAGYLDAVGLLLLFFLLMCVFQESPDKTKSKNKLLAFGFGMAGALVSFGGAMGADAFISGKRFENVMNAWIDLYSPQGFQLPVSGGIEITGWWNIVLAVFLTAGVFSFWCDRKSERLRIWVLGACVVGVVWCTGMFTEELPVSLYVFLFFVVLAGLGVAEIFREPVTAKVQGSTFSGLSESVETKEDAKKLTVLDETEILVTAVAAKESETQKPVTEVPEAEKNEKEDQTAKEPKTIKYLENPLPLPKPHVKKTMNYDRTPSVEGDDFDIPVSDDDDFDI